MARFWLACIVALSVVTGIVARQQDPVFRTSVDVVAVNALVTDNGKPVVGLRADDFEVLDSGVPQRIELTGTADGVDVVLVLDVSGSVSGKMLSHLVEAGRTLLGGLTARDRVSLVTFSERIERPASGTADVASVLARLQAAKGEGRTALYDAVYVGLSAVPKNVLRPSLLLVLTDGIDNSSWLTSSQLLEALQRNNSALYVLGRPDLFTPITNMALYTGGQLFPAKVDEKLAATFVRVLKIFRSGYLLSFTPEGVKRGDGWHSLTIRPRNPKWEVKARSGYQSR